jgi:hypothetical protein
MEGPSAPVDYWGGFMSQAKDLAAKAQVYAEEAGKIATEKAIKLADKAKEMQQTYDVDGFLANLGGGIPGSDAGGRNGNGGNGSNGTGLAKVNEVIDLVYVTENLIAMAHPADPKQLSTTSDKPVVVFTSL